MAIYFNDIIVDVPITVKDPALSLLHQEIELDHKDHFVGLTGGDGKYVAHIKVDVGEATKQEVRNALAGYEVRIGGEYARKTAIEAMRPQIGDTVANVLLSGKTDVVILDNYRSRHNDPKQDAESPVLSDEDFARLQKAHWEDLPRQLAAFDIRLRILGELQKNLGPEIVNLAFIHGDAYVSMTGIVPRDVVAKIQAIADKHDASKAQPAPKPETEQMKDDIAELKTMIAKLLKEKGK